MRKEYLKKIDTLELPVFREQVSAISFGHPMPDAENWFGYCFQELPDPQFLLMGNRCYLDFGNHYTGYLSFRMEKVERYPDAPTRVMVRFGENLRELEYDYDKYDGALSPIWLQQAVVDIDEPGIIRLPRRYSFRYLFLEVLNSRKPLRFTNFTVEAVTTADTTKLKPFQCKDPQLLKMDAVGVHTLRECMQGVFEDGPKRDRRLWIGDLRLQALTNYVTFDNRELVRKCMYLFACYSRPGERTDRFVYDYKDGTQGSDSYFADYSLMFPICLWDYYEHTADKEFAEELFEIACEQMDIALENVTDGLLNPIEEWWCFIDWRRGLQKRTAMQGVLLYALEKTENLCRALGQLEKAEQYAAHTKHMRQTAYNKLYDSKKGLFVNGYDENQLSVHSQVWMILGGVVSMEESQDILKKILSGRKMIQPVTPYMHHYFVEALLKAEMKEEALAYMRDYWGGMVEKGADTYWEVYVPSDREISPYDSFVMNSSCHAWSCSVSYFLRKYYQCEEKEGV